jgi:TPR repeat protein
MEFKKLTDGEKRDWTSLEEGGPAARRMHEAIGDDEAFDLIANVCGYAALEKFDYMYEALGAAGATLPRFVANPEFRRLLMRAYEHAIACGDGPACCNLANMYHETDVGGSTDDYATAAELYRLGASRGDAQSSVNLGYIYYYGRGREVDYTRAHECWSLAALVGSNPEAYWKLGDLYAGGRGVDKSDRVAWQLYCRAYQLCDDSSLIARPAHHMADYLLSGIEDLLDEDPDSALALYNEAERGYYVLIDNGLTYYQRQLDQCVEGQAKARAAVIEKHAKIRVGE